jgi:urease accessory protein
MPWHAELSLRYRQAQGKTLCDFAHSGPLRVLQSLYPEGDAVCHNVLVHPPSGLVGGDALQINVDVAAGAHALVSTPGATRFYRSTGEAASQRVQVRAAEGARLEWLPLENIAYNGCEAHNTLELVLERGAQMIGWDVLALGLPAAGEAFERGSFTQQVQLPGVWLERGVIRASDTRLLHSPLGLAGKCCLATMYLASGSPVAAPERERLAEATRALLQAHPLARSAGLTWPNPQVMVLRVLSDMVEPAMQLLQQVWAVWRKEAWGMSASAPRIWRV